MGKEILDFVDKYTCHEILTPMDVSRESDSCCDWRTTTVTGVTTLISMQEFYFYFTVYNV